MTLSFEQICPLFEEDAMERSEANQKKEFYFEEYAQTL